MRWLERTLSCTVRLHRACTGISVSTDGTTGTCTCRCHNEEHEWCAAQELLPFGYRIDSTYRTERGAREMASYSVYLRVYRTAWVRAENERLAKPAEFDAALRTWTRYKGR